MQTVGEKHLKLQATASFIPPVFFRSKQAGQRVCRADWNLVPRNILQREVLVLASRL